MSLTPNYGVTNSPPFHNKKSLTLPLSTTKKSLVTLFPCPYATTPYPYITTFPSPKIFVCSGVNYDGTFPPSARRDALNPPSQKRVGGPNGRQGLHVAQPSAKCLQSSSWNKRVYAYVRFVLPKHGEGFHLRFPPLLPLLPLSLQLVLLHPSRRGK